MSHPALLSQVVHSCLVEFIHTRRVSMNSVGWSRAFA